MIRLVSALVLASSVATTVVVSSFDHDHGASPTAAGYAEPGYHADANGQCGTFANPWCLKSTILFAVPDSAFAWGVKYDDTSGSCIMGQFATPTVIFGSIKWRWTQSQLCDPSKGAAACSGGCR
jgi:hypothetical protein